MEVLKVQPIMYNQAMQNQNGQQRSKTPEKPINANRPKAEIHDIQDIIERKKAGEPLSIGEEKVIEMIEKVNKSLLKPPTELRISIHEKSRRVLVKIINTENHEIIREIPSEKLLDKEVVKEIPSEKLLDTIAMMWELAGLFVNEKA